MGNNIISDIRSAIGRIGAGVVALVLKLGTKLLTVFAKFAKIGKFGLAITSAATYSYLFTWKFAIMIMVLLVVHEYGHIWAMKRCGLKTKGIYFIPFLGAAAVTEEMFKSRRDEAYIAIMGPIFGLLLSGVSLAIYIVTKDALFAAAAGWMAMINLFNLLPINPLDGGRIMKSVAFSIDSNLGYVFLATGIFLSIILTFWAGIILFFFLLIVGAVEFFIEYKIRNENEVIKKCIKDIDKIDSDNYPEDMRSSACYIKSILSDKSVEPKVRINTIISIAKKFSIENSETECINTMLAYVILPILERCDNMPRMTSRGVAITAVAYISTSTILWLLMTYISHVPEVEIARKFFMS